MRAGEPPDPPYTIEREIVECLKSSLYRRMRFLVLPLGSLEAEFSPEVEKAALSGERLILNPQWLRESFRQGSLEGGLFILHSLYHALLGHPRLAPGVREFPPGWDAACDLAVWRLIGETWPEALPPPYGALCAEAAEKAGGALTAGALCPGLGEDAELRARFCLDDHRPWGRSPGAPPKPGTLGASGAGLAEGLGGGLRELADRRPHRGRAERDLRTPLTLGPALGGRSNYGAVLRRFARNGETPRINPEEFQYAWYHYGLAHYHQVPIIEPLEYQERRALRELGIVIDTSASCSRDLSRRFLQETRRLVQEEGLFFDRFNLHIIQCDHRVQRDDKITTLEDFSAYLDTLEIRGQGGTDFRPAFAHLNTLLETGEFSRLPGVLYFTDGSGFYPAQQPPYEAVFVFIRDRYDPIDLPPWAASLILGG